MLRAWPCVALVFATLVVSGGADAADYSSPGGPDVSAARALIKAKDFAGAITVLRRLEYTEHPDVYSLLGYSYRKSGDRPRAFAYYKKALDGDPAHLGALEYQGELFVETGQIDHARENLARLRKLCPQGCEEYEDLEEDITAAAKRK